ncbi:hypothetical protein HDU98_002285 [Podochytrium sp. JEL0797]|nr:hypothetical protein HDU98_002285 [Podochytrium sp. JEL0797]
MMFSLLHRTFTTTTPPRPPAAKHRISDFIGKQTLPRLTSLGLSPPRPTPASLAAVHASFPLQNPIPIPLTVSLVSETGLGICIHNGWIFAVPTVIPGETVLIKPYSHLNGASLCDLVEVVEKSTARVHPKCKVFDQCSSCSFQHWEYANHLAYKREIVKAQFAACIESGMVKEEDIEAFEATPKEYGYRSKLTPHHGNVTAHSKLDSVGFLMRGRGRKVVDVERCEIATEVVNEGLRRIRSGLIGSVKPIDRIGATFHIRQTWGMNPTTSTKHTLPHFTPTSTPSNPVESRTMKLEDFIKRVKATPAGVSPLTPTPDSISSKSRDPLCKQLGLTPSPNLEPYPPKHLIPSPVTSTKTTILDTVNSHVLRSPSNSFFQTNSHILPHLVSHVSHQLTHNPRLHTPMLIDAYCGTGLFAITLAARFQEVIGVELDATSIEWARQNARDNCVANVRFVSGDVGGMFEGIVGEIRGGKVGGGGDIGGEVSLVIDPPKVGCSEDFLNQVMRLNPRVIVYVSCNPETQARDLEVIGRLGREGVPPASVVGSVGGEEGEGGVKEGLEGGKVLYVGGMRIVRRRDGVSVEQVEGGVAVDVDEGDGRSGRRGGLPAAPLLRVKGYVVTKVKPFDMFPQTARSEVVVTLVREDYL